jgi:hypothetical protein
MAPPVKPSINNRAVSAVHLKNQTALASFGSYTSSVVATDLVTLTLVGPGVLVTKLGCDTLIPFGNILSVVLAPEVP